MSLSLFGNGIEFRFDDISINVKYIKRIVGFNSATMVPIDLWQNNGRSLIAAKLYRSSVFMTHLGCYIYEFDIENNVSVYIPVFSENEAVLYSTNARDLAERSLYSSARELLERSNDVLDIPDDSDIDDVDDYDMLDDED